MWIYYHNYNKKNKTTISGVSGCREAGSQVGVHPQWGPGTTEHNLTGRVGTSTKPLRPGNFVEIWTEKLSILFT